MSENKHRLLLLIPAYNEEDRIGPVLRDYATFFQEHYTGSFELVVVLNGCVDNTQAVVQAVASEFDFIRFVCMVDGSRANRELGFRPRHTLREAIRAVEQATGAVR